MKKLFIVVTLLLGVTLVAMVLTKPEPKAHYDAVVGLAQNVVDQEMSSDNVKKKIAQAGEIIVEPAHIHVPAGHGRVERRIIPLPLSAYRIRIQVVAHQVDAVYELPFQYAL